MQEVGRELIFTLLQFLFRNILLLEDRDVEGILLALEEMSVEEVDDFARVLPRPGAKDSGTIDCVLTHVVIEQWVEVEVRKATHLTLQPTHLKLCLVVHLPDELLTVLELHPELFLLFAVEIGALLHNEIELEKVDEKIDNDD